MKEMLIKIKDDAIETIKEENTILNVLNKVDFAIRNGIILRETKLRYDIVYLVYNTEPHQEKFLKKIFSTREKANEYVKQQSPWNSYEIIEERVN